MVRYKLFLLRHKYDAVTMEDLIVACNELISSLLTILQIINKQKYQTAYVSNL